MKKKFEISEILAEMCSTIVMVYESGMFNKMPKEKLSSILEECHHSLPPSLLRDRFVNATNQVAFEELTDEVISSIVNLADEVLDAYRRGYYIEY